MASSFSLTGTYQAIPSLNMPSGDPLITAAIDERQTLVYEVAGQVLLTDDNSFPLSFSGLASASAVMIKVTGGTAKLALFTSTSGPDYVNVDSFFALMAAAKPLTSIEIYRQPGVPVLVKYFLGQRAE